MAGKFGMKSPKKLKPIEPRFWSKVIKSEGCWKWTGAAHPHGYGVMGGLCIGRKIIRATHVSWLIHKGVLPTHGMCHTCDNPNCVNPEHLFDGDQKANFEDMKRKGRCTLKGQTA